LLGVILLPDKACANLISNPGFEQGSKNWKSFKPENQDAVMRIANNHPESAHSGSGYAMIWPTWGNSAGGYYGFYQRILNPTPNQPWRISGWIATSPAIWSGTPQGWIQAEFYDNTEGGMEHRIWRDIVTPRLSSVTKEYSYFQSPVGYVPSNAKMAQVVTLVYCANASDSGLYGFDDLNLEVVPEPASFLLVLIGLGGLAFIRRNNTDKK
jgi:hypothetical protein